MATVTYISPEPFIAHLMPTGAPLYLVILLPIVELASQIIRPFTLCIRLATNLASGHILLFIFSYFATFGSSFLPAIFPLLRILYILELFVVMLQAYIFITLMILYCEETL